MLKLKVKQSVKNRNNRDQTMGANISFIIKDSHLSNTTCKDILKAV